MPDTTATASFAKLIEDWPPDRISALATATDSKEIEAGASALRDALELCMQMGRERPRPSAVSAKTRRDIAEMRKTVLKMLRDQEAAASAAKLSSAI